MEKKTDLEKKKKPNHSASKFINTEPELKEFLDYLELMPDDLYEIGLDLLSPELQERVMSVAQRRKAGRSARKNRSKLKRGRRKSNKRTADRSTVERRAKARARRELKKKYAGGKSYSSLSPSQKVSIDKKVSKVSDSRLKSMARKKIGQTRKDDRRRKTRKESAIVNYTYSSLSEQDKKAKNDPCWKGYKKVPGKKDYEKGSCVKENTTMDRQYGTTSLSKIYMKDTPGQPIVSFDTSLPFGKSRRVGVLVDNGVKKRVLATNGRFYTTESFDILENDTCPLVTRDQMKQFETIVDKLFKSFGIDFEFTRHFRDRMGDERNNPCISLKDLASTIQKLYMHYKKVGKGTLRKYKDTEVVLKDIQSALNIPVSLEYDRETDMLYVIAKTIMRKANFKTPNPIVRI